MNWRELNMWAKNNDFKLKKIKGEKRYVWIENNLPLAEYDNIEKLQLDLWNFKTHGRWVKYQNNCRKIKKDTGLYPWEDTIVVGKTQ